MTRRSSPSRARPGTSAFVYGGLAVAAVAVACSGARDEAPRTSIATSFTMPRAVLDRVTKITLQVLEGSVTCDPATGAVAYPEGNTAARELQKRDLVSDSCPANVRFCGDFSIDKSDAIRVFAATAKGDGDATLAVGCASAKIEQDAVPIAIKMYRFIAPAVCNDGVVQPTEQCEPGGDVVCDDACQTKELLLSTGSGQNGTQTGDPGTKLDPFFVWPNGGGTAGRFFAFFTDRSVPNASNNAEVGLRALSPELAPLSTPPVLAAGAMFLPNGGPIPPQPAVRNQSSPQAAAVGNRFYVVFQDDDGASLDIKIRSFDDALQADGTVARTVNGAGATPAGEANIQQVPAIAAGPQNRLFIAWEDASGKIVGRTLTPPSTFGPQNDLSTGTGNSKVSLAPTTTGWVAVWQSGTGVKLRAVNDTGTPQGAEQIVSESGATVERPRVASLGDGRFAVAWSAGGDLFAQRFDAKGSKIAGDQATPVNDVVTSGAQTQAAIGATAAAGGSYVVAWVDEDSGHVRARMLGGSAGFLFNNVNGQSTEFQASREEGRTRANPAVVSGGSGPFVAIGWEDTTNTVNIAGVVVRRFPLPSE